METEKTSRWAVAVHYAVATLVVVGFVAFAHAYVGHVHTIRNVDYFQFVDMAVGLRAGGIESWVSGMHPVGYPWLIRIGLGLGLDAVTIGQGLAVLGGVLLLGGAYFIAYRLTGDRWLALATGAILATTGHFLFFGTLEGNDMVSASLTVVSLGFLINRDGDARRSRDCLFAGLLSGLAYLARYTAVIPTALLLVFLTGQAAVTRERRRWGHAAMFLGAFLAGAAPQMIPSVIVTGNPLYSTSGHNLWWHVEGLSDFVTEWEGAPMSMSALQVLLANPAKLLQHWWRTARSFWLDPALLLLDVPFRLFTQAALVFTLLAGRRIAPLWRGLLALFTGGLLAGLALIRYDPRFLIVILPILAFCVAYFFRAIVPERIQVGRRQVPLNAIVLAALCLWGIGNPLTALRVGPRTSETIVEISNTLRAGGMRMPEEVLSTGIPYHDVTTQERLRYPQSYWVAPAVDSAGALFAAAREHGFRFIVYDAETGQKAHPGLAFLLDPAARTEGLTPIWISESHDVCLYRIEQGTGPEVGLDARFGESLVLSGYDLTLTRDGPGEGAFRLGLFLHWEATSALTESYKVFVHVVDGNGALIAQDDSVPVLWTYPTNRWEAGSRVVDFHTARLPAEVTAGDVTVYVGLYPEADPARRLGMVTEDGARGDRVEIATLQLAAE